MANEASVQLEWRVTGMDCGSCAAKVRGAVERLPGVTTVDVAMMAERLRVELDPQQGSAGVIEKTVRGLGFGVSQRSGADGMTTEDSAGSCWGGAAQGQPQGATTQETMPWYRSGKGQLLLGTGMLLALALAIKLLASPTVGLVAFMLATVIGVTPVARRALAMLRAGMPFTIEMLMSIAAIGALFIGAAEEAALVVFLFAVGEMLEGVAANKARDGIRALAQLVPKTALLEQEDSLAEIAADRLNTGQIVVVRPGDRVPADGEVIEGISGVDESPVTGESVPRLKEPGAEVYAGSINAEAVLRVRVTRAASDNTISRIIRLVEEAESARAPTERFIDRFSRIYMPIIVSIAFLIAVVPPLAFGLDWGTWIYRALALLLIGCPCALVISVPAAIASALSAGARHGILLKGGAVIEAAARTTDVAFDKTGTLTRGRPQVTDIVVIKGHEDDLVSRAAAVERGSSHPLAVAILDHANRVGLDIQVAKDAHAMPGKGASAQVNGVRLTVGSPRYAGDCGVMDDDALAKAQKMETDGKTVVALFSDQVCYGLIALRDEPREDAFGAVAALKKLGIHPIMLTGDNARTAAAIAGQLDIDHRAELMPQGKVDALRGLTKKSQVMMVGDGINDAPALATAQVGVAMGSGTDVALETADVAILRNRVADVVGTIRLSRATLRNIRQNVAVALGLKGVFLVTSVFGITGLWIAILADTGATVLVTLNALRLLSFKPSGGAADR
ncbi:heavy metal translocating P-type ATPase [Phaeobacter porticola]|uniref:P-type Zn(2+) transporter n=1 Tax=Phaeobacter porticola TaxID=1844006 RepID=A0A1L3I1G8_9RHOB|nr:heavy metal translocating P-type ATPase [Phaeobacter porticola]APG45960.1 lead, cadmium, zinc and mercury-transporting ATPase [Phaeobacter porticola]